MRHLWGMRIAPIVMFALSVPLFASSQQAPPRDVPAPVVGSATISGVVVGADDPSKPVRHAIIKLSGRGELNRGAVTDDEGRFVITLVPVGTYTLTASKPAYLTTALGAKGPGRLGTSIVVRDGESIAGLRIPLTRGAVITGTVRDPFGEPIKGINVFLARAGTALTTVQGLDATAFATMDTTTTDDLGTYRIFGLAPGGYIVGAMPPQTGGGSSFGPELAMMSREQIDAELRALQQRGNGAASSGPVPPTPRFNYTPVFYPSATSAERAVPVRLAAGEERSGVDVSLIFVPVGTMSGVVVGADGQPGAAVALSIGRPGPALPISLGFDPSLDTRPGLDGVFRYSNVAPGTYTISARSTAQVERTVGNVTKSIGRRSDLPPGTFFWATATVEVNGGADLTGVVLQLRPGLAVNGRIVFDAAVLKPAADLAQVKLWLTPERTQPLTGSHAMLMAATRITGTVTTDGAFELRGLTPSQYTLSAQVPGGLGPTGWWVRSAMLDGQDLLDRPLILGDSDLANVTLTFSDRHTELAGTLTTATGQPVSDLVVVVLPEDRALWTSTRRIQQTRPATNGRFAFTDLPPGHYLLAAVTDVPDEHWRTDEFLSGIAPAGVKVTIGEGEKKTQDLRIGR